MNNLPVLWRVDFDLGAGMVYNNEYCAGETASPLETLANYMRVKNVIIHIGRMG